MLGSKLYRFSQMLQSLEHYQLAQKTTPPASMIDAETVSEHRQFNLLCSELEAYGFQPQGFVKEYDNEFAHPSSIPTSLFKSFSFDDGRGLILMGSKGRRFAGCYVKRKERKTGLFDLIMNTVFQCAELTSSSLFIYPKKYELDLPSDENLVDYLKFPRASYRFVDDKENERWFQRLKREYPRLKEVYLEGQPKMLVFRPQVESRGSSH